MEGSKEIIRFLPSYVGSKKYWVLLLQKYKNEDFVELFAGSAVLSANLARTAILNDIDEKIYQILKYFDQLIVPEIFTFNDFDRFKQRADWWKWAYCLQKMSFSGVFRYSNNGYNVPIKKLDGVPSVKEIRIQKEYDRALIRWKGLQPIVFNKSYLEIDLTLLKNKVVVLDPPYEGSKASYNTGFNYKNYWEFVDRIKLIAKVVIVFDRQSNLKLKNIPVVGVRKMRVNGDKNGDVESVGIFENGIWSTAPLGDCETFISEETMKNAPKPKRGRPRGSKNKPKINI